MHWVTRLLIKLSWTAKKAQDLAPVYLIIPFTICICLKGYVRLGGTQGTMILAWVTVSRELIVALEGKRGKRECALHLKWSLLQTLPCCLHNRPFSKDFTATKKKYICKINIVCSFLNFPLKVISLWHVSKVALSLFVVVKFAKSAISYFGTTTALPSSSLR